MKFFVVICVDVDVLIKLDDVNQEGCEVLVDLLCVDFYYWVFVDFLVFCMEFVEGEFFEGVMEGGKVGFEVVGGICQGMNNYMQWFVGDLVMGGDWFGYDGLCLFWNDSFVYYYYYKVFVFDVVNLVVFGIFDGFVVLVVMEGYVFVEVLIMGIYILNLCLVG